MDLDSLKKLSVKVIKLTEFVDNYGSILSILNEKMEPMTTVTIAQFCNPPLCCFTFSDFQLAPTLEELERIIGQNLRDHDPFPKFDEGITVKRITSVLGLEVQLVISNWDKKGAFNVFSRWFLEEQVVKLEKEGKQKAFHVVLALLVDSIVSKSRQFRRSCGRKNIPL